MGEFCAKCGLTRDEHPPDPPPGPPSPPRIKGHLGATEDYRPPHAFVPHELTLEELLAERDAQIDRWRRRAYNAERLVQQVRELVKATKGERDG